MTFSSCNSHHVAARTTFRQINFGIPTISVQHLELLEDGDFDLVTVFCNLLLSYLHGALAINEQIADTTCVVHFLLYNFFYFIVPS